MEELFITLERVTQIDNNCKLSFVVENRTRLSFSKNNIVATVVSRKGRTYNLVSRNMGPMPTAIIPLPVGLAIGRRLRYEKGIGDLNFSEIYEIGGLEFFNEKVDVQFVMSR